MDTFLHREKPGAVIRVSDEDSLDYLQSQLSVNLSVLEKDGCRFALRLNTRGRVLAGIYVLRTAEEEFLLVSRTSKASFLLELLAENVVADEVEFSDETKQWNIHAVWGGDTEKVLEDLLEEGKQPKEIQVVCLACYKPLHSYKWCSRLDLTSFVNQLIDRQISEPLREKNIGKNIKFLTGEEDEVSFKVGKQYEENPYPRWVDMGLNFEKKGIRDIATDANLFIYDQTIFENNALRILIAGCGTGQHAISRSQAIKNCDVLAIDLSTASLAYAERKTQEFGIKNVEYMKADILNLEKF